MAIAANEVQLNITDKIPLENGRAMYTGTATGGTGYATGGATIGIDATSVWKGPEKWDSFTLYALGAQASFVKPNKVKLFGAPTTEGTVAVEFKNAASMATVVGAVPFMAIGPG